LKLRSHPASPAEIYPVLGRFAGTKFLSQEGTGWRAGDTDPPSPMSAIGPSPGCCDLSPANQTRERH
jgi:hypothetical protein